MELPEEFIRRSEGLPGMDMPAFIRALSLSPPVSVRYNHKGEAATDDYQAVPWCSDGFYLKERPLFTADPLFHGGVYYVQEASSMFLNFVAGLYLRDVGRVLDLCAAPGGKSTLLCNVLSENALLISNEINRSRAMILAENIIKWGNTNAVVTNNSPEDFHKSGFQFDAVLVDAPCSGEGMFRKDPDSVKEWNMQNIRNCVVRQKQILSEIDACISDEGILIYSTCTYNEEENEQNIAWFSEEYSYEILKPDISTFEGIVSSTYGYRFYPDKIQGEGFFISILRKKTDKIQHSGTKYVKNNKANLSKELEKKILINQSGFLFLEDQQQISAFPRHLSQDMLYMKDKFNCLVCGTALFQKKGKDLIPSHQLALSKALDINSFNSTEVNRETALKFLKRENIFLSEEKPVGYLLITYLGIPMGWVKNLGNRCNNLYPAHWRIRMNI